MGFCGFTTNNHFLQKGFTMKKAISTINIPTLNIHVGDTIAIARTTLELDSILMSHSGMTFYNACEYKDMPEMSSELYDAIRDAFNAGLELDYANINFSKFMQIFSAQTIGDVNRVMSGLRASL